MKTPSRSALRPKPSKKLSWKETAKQMAKKKESWSDFNVTLSDGLLRPRQGSQRLAGG